MKKLLFAGHDLKFAKFLIDHYSNDNNYEVKIDKWQGHNIHNEDISRELLEWADIIFCEWGLGNSVWYSTNKKPYQKLIVRMHAQERKTNFPNQINYENVDYIIAISPYIYEVMHQKFKISRDKMIMIYNSVDVDYFNLEKTEDSLYNLAIIGILPSLKRLDRAIDIIERLVAIDTKYKLFIKGKLPNELMWLKNNEEENKYYTELFARINKLNLENNIIFEGYSNNINEWLRKIGVVLSTSDFESFHLAPMEGMASGAYPIIFNWDGSETIYKEEWIVKSVDEAVNKILNYSKNINKESLKEYVRSNFDKKDILKQYQEIIR